MRVPEEINRRIVDHTADINLTYSNIAREYLLKEGILSDTVIKTGSPMFEVLNHYKDKILKSKILSTLNLKEEGFYLVSIHREENIDSDKNFNHFIDTLNTISNHFDLPIIVSTHPRTQKRIDSKNIQFDERIKLLKPLGFTDYNKLQMSAKAVLSDSGTITEESSILNFPALNIREAHERPEGMEEASVMMVGLESERIMQALRILEDQDKGLPRKMLEVSDYTSPNVSEKVVRIIHSYTDYINRIVWKKF
jgi:UDP-N-acetylglucosamine 2-epimerase (non-hydrolysing)